jgi:hypothetical protein
MPHVYDTIEDTKVEHTTITTILRDNKHGTVYTKVIKMPS